MGLLDWFRSEDLTEEQVLDEVRGELISALAEQKNSEEQVTPHHLQLSRDTILQRDTDREKHLRSAFIATNHDYETFQQLVEKACEMLEQDWSALNDDEAAERRDEVIKTVEEAEQLVTDVIQSERYKEPSE